MELRCSRDLALWLGAVEPKTIDEHKAMKAAGHMLIRDGTNGVLFWQWTSERIASVRRNR